MTRSTLFVTALVLASACGASSSAPIRTAPATSLSPLPASAERTLDALASRFDERAAFEAVEFMSRSWRVAGNPGFNASIDHIRDRLAAGGFTGQSAIGSLRVDEFKNNGPGWDYSVGTVAIDGAQPEVVLSKERDRVSLCINSFPTPEGGLRAALVDVGAGTDADFAGKSLRGAVVLGDAPLGRLWQKAVKAGGAAGVISTSIAPYIRPDDPSRMTEPEKDVFQWGSVPYDPAAKAFGFKASWRAAARLRERLGAGAVTVRVDIMSTFYDGPNRSLVAEIPGRSRASERIVMVAHVQEPGANDDASGCGTLMGTALALARAIRDGVVPPPERTLTFMWVDEVRGSREWIRSRPDEAKGVQYMMSLDMTGEDVSKTGGSFLVEKQADPSAVWQRPSDPHTAWGAGEVKAESLKGSLLNDVHLAVCRRRAEFTGWVVKTNPYEGGSDHTAFADAGVPSLLNWHFTDRYYHTNQDTPDKTSAAEMANVGVAVGTTAWLLASAGDAEALAVVSIVERAARARLLLEAEQGPQVVAAAADRAAAEAVEAQVQAAWKKWYDEALESALALPVTGASAALRERVAAARSTLR